MSTAALPGFAKINTTHLIIAGLASILIYALVSKAAGKAVTNISEFSKGVRTLIGDTSWLGPKVEQTAAAASASADYKALGYLDNNGKITPKGQAYITSQSKSLNDYFESASTIGSW